MFVLLFVFFFFFKQKTAYEMRISDWSSDVCSSDLVVLDFRFGDRTKDIKQRFSRRAPSDRPVETIFIDAAEVAEQRRILNRIISGGEPVVVHGVPSGQLRLDIAARPAQADRKSTRLNSSH